MADMPEYMKKIAGWELTTTSVGANADDLVDLMARRDRLEVITNRFKELSLQHALLRSTKQETMLEMKALFREGETLAHTLRTAVRQHYGLASEKLVEFGLRPSRPRSRKAPVPPGPEAPAPVEPAGDPDSTADPDSMR